MISEHLFRERRPENQPGAKMSTTPKIQKNATGPSAILKASNLNKIPGQKDPLKAAKDIKQQIDDLQMYASKAAEVLDAIEEHLPQSETRLNMQRNNNIAKLDQFKERLIRVLNDRNPNQKRPTRMSESLVEFSRVDVTELAVSDSTAFDNFPVEEEEPHVEDEAIQVVQVRRPLKLAGDAVEFHVPLELPVVVKPVEGVKTCQSAGVQAVEAVGDVAVQAHKEVMLMDKEVEVSDDEEGELETEDVSDLVMEQHQVNEEMLKYVRRLRFGNTFMMFLLFLIIAAPLLMFND